MADLADELAGEQLDARGYWRTVLDPALGPVRGPDRAKDMPVAVSNPIYVDVDGGGFKANGDTLGAPLPVKR